MLAGRSFLGMVCLVSYWGVLLVSVVGFCAGGGPCVLFLVVVWWVLAVASAAGAARQHNRELAETYAPDLVVLSDPGLEAIEAYGVRHVGGGLDGDVARPATFLIDREGRIFWRELTENWRIRPRPAELLSELSRD